jgi:hypothetical protein
MTDYSEVILLWQEAPYKTNRMFDRPLLPAVEWVAEVGPYTKHFIDLFMFNVL